MINGLYILSLLAFTIIGLAFLYDTDLLKVENSPKEQVEDLLGKFQALLNTWEGTPCVTGSSLHVNQSTLFLVNFKFFSVKLMDTSLANAPANIFVRDIDRQRCVLTHCKPWGVNEGLVVFIALDGKWEL